MISTEQAINQYAQALNIWHRAKNANKPDYILNNIQEAIDFWKSKMKPDDLLTQEIEMVMREYKEAKVVWDVV